MKKVFKYGVADSHSRSRRFCCFLPMSQSRSMNGYKPQIVAFVGDETGRTLSLEGNIGLKPFSGIGLNLGKASSLKDKVKEQILKGLFGS